MGGRAGLSPIRRWKGGAAGFAETQRETAGLRVMVLESLPQTALYVAAKSRVNGRPSRQSLGFDALRGGSIAGSLPT